jgi:hypothetical protein
MEVCHDSDYYIFLSDCFIGRCTYKDFYPVGLLRYCTHKEKEKRKEVHFPEKDGDILYHNSDIERRAYYHFAACRIHSAYC